jgi:hypothetical protein
MLILSYIFFNLIFIVVIYLEWKVLEALAKDLGSAQYLIDQLRNNKLYQPNQKKIFDQKTIALIELATNNTNANEASNAALIVVKHLNKQLKGK